MAARSHSTGGVGANKDYLLPYLIWVFPVQEDNIIFQHSPVLPPWIPCVPPHKGWGVAKTQVSFITVDSVPGKPLWKTGTTTSTFFLTEGIHYRGLFTR